MSNNIGHSSSSDASQSLKKSSILRRSMAFPVLLDPALETKRGGAISQPCPPANDDDDDLKLGEGALPVSKMIHKDLIFMKEAVDKVNKLNKNMEGLNVEIKQAREQFRERQTSGSETELEELRKTVSKLRRSIPSIPNKRSADSNHLQDPWTKEYIDNSNSSSIQADHVNNASEESTIIYFKEFFRNPGRKDHLLLYCFLNFPKNTIIKKRFIVYWWIGAGLINSKEANTVFENVVAMGFIEPVYEKSGLVADSCRIHPLLYSILKYYAESNPWVVDSRILNSKKMFYLYDGPKSGSATSYDGPDLLSEMEQDAKILHLGRWGRWGSWAFHIEVTNMTFFDRLKNMKNMKELRFLSLRGISLITELPQYILNHTNLMILDLRACYNLETLPARIDLLKNLTHLDTSECYFLEQMPKALATLQNLEVLKGFVIGDSMGNTSCSLGDLARLRNLIKLNIYYRGVKNFPTNEQLKELERFHVLKKLTISWGGNSSEIESLENQEVLSLALHKLDLQGFPGTKVPNWLRPANLKELKKLYLKGGKLCDLQQLQGLNDEKFLVEILRFKYLEFSLSWGDLRSWFPKLEYLEIKDCLDQSGSQCDKNGVWINEAKDEALVRNVMIKNSQCLF